MGSDMPASIRPGATVFTRMPEPAHSSAICWLSMTTAAFEALYEPENGAAERPLIDAMFTIEPAPTAAISRAAVRATRKVPVRLTRSACSQSASDRSSSGPNRTMPALLTTAAGTSGRLSNPSRTAASSVTSTRRATAPSPSLAATDSAEDRSTSHTATRYPVRATCSAMVAPMPRPAPVTTTNDPTPDSSSSRPPVRRCVPNYGRTVATSNPPVHGQPTTYDVRISASLVN